MKRHTEFSGPQQSLRMRGLLSNIAVLCGLLGVLTGCSGPSTPPPMLPTANSLQASCMTGNVGSNYSCPLTVTSGASPFTWMATGLPKGLSLTVSADTTSATISGTIQPLVGIVRGAARSEARHAEATDPTTSVSVTVTVTDAKGRTATVTFSITVTFPSLTMSTTSLSPGTAGTGYSASVTGSGGISPYTWTIMGLPAGLSSAPGTPSATISGTTNHVGTFSVIVSVSDSETPPATATATLSLTIAQAATLMITTTTLPNGTMGSAYSQTLAATGGVTPFTWSVASGTLPAGLTLSAAGVISGTPTAIGTSSFTVQAVDAETPAQTVAKALSITILAPPLSVTTASLPPGVVGKAYANGTLQSSGGQPPVSWSISSGSLPAGLSLNASTRAITGSPTTAGTSTFAVKATDSSTPTPQIATKQLSIQILAALAITTASPLPGGIAGTGYTGGGVAAAGGVTPYTWTITGLPAGLSYASGTPSAAISGTTNHVGTFSVTATVSDSETVPATATAMLSLTIAQAATLMISTTTLPNGTMGSAYSQTLAATGGVTPFTWSVASGTLPAGLTLSSAGVLSGTPTATGPASFTVQAADAEIPAQTTTQALSLTINAATSGLNITTSSPLTNGTLSTAYSAMVTASGGTPPYTWSLGSGSALPAGLSLTSGTPGATISGTPTATGTFQFTLDVKDSAGTPATSSASFLITISGSTTLNCPATVNLTLCGAYGLGIQGFVGTTGPAVIGASFLADNSGHIVSGVEDTNSVSGGQANVSITGGSYVMDTSGDGRGVLTLIYANAGSRTFRFVLESAANPGIGAIEEFDASGTLAGGVLAGPGTLPFASIPANTIFGMVLEGYNGSGQRAGMIGEFQVGSSGCNGASGSFNSLAGEHVVTNTAGTVNTALTVTGSCTAPDPNTGRGAIQITISGGTPYTNSTLNFFYYASGTAATGLQGVLVGEADAIGANQPILSGLAQVASSSGGGFASCASPAACILAGHGTTDGTITTGHAVASLVRAAGTPATATTGTVAGVLDENFGGTITTAGTWPYTAYADDANGNGTLTGTGPTIHYLRDGQFMDESVSVITGDTNGQNTTTIENPGAPYIFGESIGSSAVGATPSVPHVTGVVTSSGTSTGTYSGSLDISSSAGQSVGFTPSGSYTINSTTGRGTGTANFTGGASGVSVVIYGNRHRRFSVLDMQSSNPFVLGARLQ